MSEEEPYISEKERREAEERFLKEVEAEERFLKEVEADIRFSETRQDVLSVDSNEKISTNEKPKISLNEKFKEYILRSWKENEILNKLIPNEHKKQELIDNYILYCYNIKNFIDWLKELIKLNKYTKIEELEKEINESKIDIKNLEDLEEDIW